MAASSDSATSAVVPANFSLGGQFDVRLELPSVPSPGGVQLALDAARQRLNQVLVRSGCLARLQDAPLVDALPVMTVSVIMGSLYYAYMGVLLPVQGHSFLSPDAIAFNASFLLTVASYSKGVLSEPGRVPESWRAPDPQTLPAGVLELLELGPQLVMRKKKTGGFRYCHKEHVFKPDRAHFCRRLNRNVLRMDHYCVWLNNCIGHGNHKHFLLFLLYSTLSVNIADFKLIRAFATGHTGNAVQFLMIAYGTLTCTTLAAVITPFFAFHCFLLLNNLTTIEFLERANSSTSHFDLGPLRNVQSVMGKEPELWLLPVGGPIGDGIVFESTDAFSSTSDDAGRSDDTTGEDKQNATHAHDMLAFSGPWGRIGFAFQELIQDMSEHVQDVTRSLVGTSPGPATASGTASSSSSSRAA